ncbi:MAG: Maf family nucleotide pyrophosphatase [Candidatus Omnitrophica bacterium]|nr:Maf family nucleotide pyrophosphatase [Candidatus Omnitrophota bacterium]
MSYIKKKILILASSSSCRNKILKDCRVNFKVIFPSIKEIRPTRFYDISSLVKQNASFKVDAVKDKVKDGIILGLDTLVLFKKKIVGKLKSKEEARKFLRDIIGKKIFVYTGICILDKINQNRVCGYDRTIVYVRQISPHKIDRYIEYLGPYNKAGGFSLEGIGGVIFDRLEGSYFNVLGLPLRKIGVLLEKMNLDILDFMR